MVLILVFLKHNCCFFLFQTFAVFCMLYVSFWVIPRRLNFRRRGITQKKTYNIVVVVYRSCFCKRNQLDSMANKFLIELKLLLLEHVYVLFHNVC
jgi:hypothetical protein